MRYYDLKISDPVTGGVWITGGTSDGFTKSKNGGTTFTSYARGASIPGALNVEFDIPVAPFNTPQGQALIRVWGVGLGMIGQAADLNGQNISLSAGMKKGLPLANPAQAGLILQGTIFQAFGNWQGTNQTLDLICNPPIAQQNQDILFNWPAGTELSAALNNAFSQQSFSRYNLTPKGTISSLIQNNDEYGTYSGLSQFASFIQGLSQHIGAATYGEDYSGVLITVTGNTIFVYDNRHPREVISLAFPDLIGQPTWINPATINFKAVLRSDITVGNQIKFPAGVFAPYVLTSAAAAAPNTPSRSKSAFQGIFDVVEAHHFGNFRQPDADSWNTTYNAVAVPV